MLENRFVMNAFETKVFWTVRLVTKAFDTYRFVTMASFMVTLVTLKLTLVWKMLEMY